MCLRAVFLAGQCQVGLVGLVGLGSGKDGESEAGEVIDEGVATWLCG
jgi:hypothetical protein